MFSCKQRYTFSKEKRKQYFKKYVCLNFSQSYLVLITNKWYTEVQLKPPATEFSLKVFTVNTVTSVTG